MKGDSCGRICTTVHMWKQMTALGSQYFLSTVDGFQERNLVCQTCTAGRSCAGPPHWPQFDFNETKRYTIKYKITGNCGLCSIETHFIQLCGKTVEGSGLDSNL